MKLTSIEIHPTNSFEVVVLSFRDRTNVEKYNVKSILGLDADEITPQYYGTFGSSKFYNLGLPKRDVVVKVGLNPNFSENETYSDLRDALYKIVSTSRTGKVQLQFKNGVDVIAAVSGFVIKFESLLFEKNQEVQITIKCDDSLLKALDPVNVPVTVLDPSITFISDSLSTAPHGFKFEMAITASIASIIITSPTDSPDDTDTTFEIVPSGGFLNGDVLHFSSELNDKYLYLIRGANIIQLADVITPGSQWPIMFPGNTGLIFTNPTALDWGSISYYPTYWGV